MTKQEIEQLCLQAESRADCGEKQGPRHLIDALRTLQVRDPIGLAARLLSAYRAREAAQLDLECAFMTAGVSVCHVD